MAVLYVLWLFVPVVICYLRFSRDKLDPIAMVSYLFIFAYALRSSMLLLGLADFRYDGLYRDSPLDLLEEAVIIFGIAYISVVAGYAARGPYTRFIARQLPFSPDRRVRTGRLEAIVVAGLSFCLLIIGLLIVRNGGIAEFMFAARTGTALEGLRVVSKLPLLVSVLTVILVIEKLRARESIIRPALYLAGCAALIFSLGDRSGMVIPILVLTVLYNFSIRRVRLGRLAAVLGAGVLAIFLLGVIRDAVFRSRFTGENIGVVVVDALQTEVGASAGAVAGALNMRPIDHFLFIVQDYSFQNFRSGEDFVTGVIALVPRGIWPGKPENITPGRWFKAQYFPESGGGKPYTGIGIWWINFGIFGVIAGGFLSGLFLRGIWEGMKMRGFGVWNVVFYGAWLFYCTSYGLIVSTSLVAVVTILIPLVLIHRFVTLPARPAEGVVPAWGASRGLLVQRP